MAPSVKAQSLSNKRANAMYDKYTDYKMHTYSLKIFPLSGRILFGLTIIHLGSCFDNTNTDQDAIF